MARQVQAQQQQMAQSGLPMAVPQGTPQPQRQPEMGLDQIQSNLGEYYGGGIVAFNGNGPSLVSEEKLSEEGKKWLEESRRGRVAEAPKSTSGSSYKDLPKTAGQSGLSALIRNLAPILSSPTALSTLLGGAALTGGATNALSNATPEMREQLMGDVGSDTSLAAAILNAAKPSNKPSEPEQVKDLAPAKSEAAPPPDEAPAKPPAEKKIGLPDSPRLNPAPARPSVPSAPTAEPAAAIKPTAEQDFFASRMEENPTLAAQDAANKFVKNVGPQGFNEERELIKELQARRANIGKGTNPLMDLLEGIATSTPGRGGILSQGAEGVRNARSMQQQREQQNMDMLKEILGQQKVISTGERAYKKDLFDLYQNTYKEVYKNTFDAAKAKDVSDRDAAKLAQDAAEHAANRKSQEQIADDRNKNSINVANIGAASRKKDDAILNLSRADAAVTNRVRSDEVINTLQERLKKLGDMLTKENAIEAKQIMKDISDRQSKIMKEVYSRYGIKDFDDVKIPEATGTTGPGNRAPLSSFQR
jgi:hypothetical protein